MNLKSLIVPCRFPKKTCACVRWPSIAQRGIYTFTIIVLLNWRGREVWSDYYEGTRTCRQIICQEIFVFVCLFVFQNSDPMKCAYSLNQDFSSKRTKLKITTAVQRESQQVSIDLAKFCLRALGEMPKRQLWVGILTPQYIAATPWPSISGPPATIWAKRYNCSSVGCLLETCFVGGYSLDSWRYFPFTRCQAKTHLSHGFSLSSPSVVLQLVVVVVLFIYFFSLILIWLFFLHRTPSKRFLPLMRTGKCIFR